MSTLAQYRILAKTDHGRSLLTTQRNNLTAVIEAERAKFEAAQANVDKMIGEIDQALSEIEA